MRREIGSRKRVVYAFIDAANLFYGGEKSLGWKVDYKKLFAYLKSKFLVSRAYYYAGIDIGKYKGRNEAINLDGIGAYFQREIRNKKLRKVERLESEKYLQRVKFYKKLDSFGFMLRLKPTKIFHNGKSTVKKANCDVDLTFDLMRYMSQYSEIVMLTGDGDFAPVLHYLGKKQKKIHVLARSERTAREIKAVAGDRFMDFKYLREILKIRKAPM